MGFEDCSEEKYELLVRKGIYPYEYMSSWDRFTETELPQKKKFYSDLNMSNLKIKAVTSCSTHKIDQQETDG